MSQATIIGSIVTELKLNMTQAAILSLGLLGVKLDFSAVSIGSTVLKAEVNGLALSAWGLQPELHEHQARHQGQLDVHRGRPGEVRSGDE